MDRAYPVLKQLIRDAGRLCGIDIRRRTLVTSESLRLQRFLKDHHINSVLDVGANVGQYGIALRQNGYRRQILSFEPLSSAYRRLVQVTRRDAAWRVAPRMAIGDVDGEVEINESRNSFSSSVLPLQPAHLKGAPESVYVKSERVQIRRLDSLWGTMIGPDDGPYFLKIDTQGFEDRVLDGAAGIIANISGIQIELSIVSLYAGQQLYDVMLERVIGLGFELFALFPGFVDPESGRQLQVDGVFFRRALGASLQSAGYEARHR